MGKKIWLVGLFLVGVLVGLGATSALAQEPATSDGETWEEMHQACQTGDYEAMAKWHEQCYGGEGATTGGMMGGRQSGMMGGGMMGNGWGGSRGGMMGGW